jgi:hypothetical protein
MVMLQSQVYEGIDTISVENFIAIFNLYNALTNVYLIPRQNFNVIYPAIKEIQGA